MGNRGEGTGISSVRLSLFSVQGHLAEFKITLFRKRLFSTIFPTETENVLR
jgi:hypothetical protein